MQKNTKISKIFAKKLKIGSLGVVDLDLPLTEFRSKEKGPKILLIANQHGRELSGILVLEKLFSQLNNRNDFKGSILAIPTANPLGLLLGTRNEPVESKDLNRQFPGKMGKDLVQKIAREIYEQAKQVDLVIDLHTFTSRNSPIIGISIKSSNEVMKDAKEALLALSPDVVWQIDVENAEDQRFLGALDIALCQKGIPAIAIEMPPLFNFSEKQLQKVVDGLINILSLKGMLQNKEFEAEKKEIPIFSINYFYSDMAGMFIPKKSIMDKVKGGEVIGEIVDINNLSRKKVISDQEGVILTISFRDFVRYGSKLASIGSQVGYL